VVNQAITFISTATVGGNNTISAQRLDLDGDGQFDDRVGPTATTSFSVAGSHVVRLRVVDKHGASHNHVHAETVSVLPLTNQAPIASFTFHPAQPIAGQPVSFYSTATDADSPIAAQRWDLDGNGSYGDALGPTATLSFALPGSYKVGLQVEDTTGMVAVAPGSRTAVRCRGRHCPFRWRRYRHRATIPAEIVRVRRLEGRLLRSAVRLQVFVTRVGAIGRYTRFSIRSRRPPARLDRCLVSISTRPVDARPPEWAGILQTQKAPSAETPSAYLGTSETARGPGPT
jgi:hypothetical protein